MVSTFRGKWAAWGVGIIIGLIAFVFVFEGVFSAIMGRDAGGMAGASAGKVNGDTISIADFNRALERRTEYMKGMMGGNITEEQMKMFRIREGTFQELVQQRLMSQAAKKSGMQPSDEQVRNEIMKLPYFQKKGRFDVTAYKATLTANNMTPAAFEKVIRDQLAIDAFTRSLSSSVQVSPAELKEEFLGTQEQRNVKYVSLPSQAPQAGETGPKELAEKIAKTLSSSTASDKEINAWAKPYHAEIKKTEMIAKSAGYIPGIGENAQLFNDVFSDASPIQGKAKIYEVSGRIVVATIIGAKKADLTQFEKEREKIYLQVKTKKERQIMDQMMKKLVEKADIKPNPAVVGDSKSPEQG
jgi:parvulin-like peptidyl-prolyl isomerase